MAHEVESLVLTEGLPAWHGLGVVLPNDAINAEEALTHGGLAGWNLTKQPIFHGNPEDGMTQVANWWAVVRETDHRALGVVGDGYTIVSNEEAFAWANTLVGGDGFHFKTAGSLREGAIVFLLLKTPFDIDLPDSPVEQYLLLRNRHDGHGTVNVQPTNVRVVCANTLAMAEAGARLSYSIRHTTNASEQLAEAQRVLGLTKGAAARVEKAAKAMLKRKFSLTDWQELVDTIVPVPADKGGAQTMAQEKQATLTALYRSHPTQDKITGTAWGAYNAFALYTDHATTDRDTKRGSAAENRMQRILDTDTLTQRAFAALAR